MKIRSLPQARGKPALKGGVIAYTHRGQLVSRSWPKKPSKPPTEKQLFRREWFKAAREQMKYAAAPQINLTKEGAKGTGLYPTDLMMMATSGTLPPAMDGGGVIYERWQPELKPVSFQGCVVPLLVNQGKSAGSQIVLNWTTPTIQTIGCWSVSNPSRLTVPAGVNMVSVQGGAVASISSNNFTGLRLYKFGSTKVADSVSWNTSVGANQCDTGVLNVTPGDWFDLRYYSARSGTVLKADATYFQMRIENTI